MERVIAAMHNTNALNQDLGWSVCVFVPQQRGAKEIRDDLPVALPQHIRAINFGTWDPPRYRQSQATVTSERAEGGNTDAPNLMR